MLGGLAIKKKQEHCVYFRAWKFPKSPLVLLFIGLLKNKKKSLQISEFQLNLYQKATCQDSRTSGTFMPLFDKS